MNDRWVNNDAWDVKEIYNRAPRSALHECEPTPAVKRFWRRHDHTVALLLVINGVTVLVLLAMLAYGRCY